MSGTVNTGLISETVKRRLFDKYGVEPETLSKTYAIKISKQLGFFYGQTLYRSFNKINVPDSVLLDYQPHYPQLADSGVDLDSIYNVDATKCHSNLLPRKTYKKHANTTDFVNSRVHNTHRTSVTYAQSIDNRTTNYCSTTTRCGI